MTSETIAVKTNSVPDTQPPNQTKKTDPNKIPFTDARIKALEFAGQRDVVWDANGGGIGLRINKKKKTFFVEVKGDRFTIGVYGEAAGCFNYRQAKDRAIEYHADPYGTEKKYSKVFEKPAPVIAEMTFGELCTRYLEDRAEIIIDGKPRKKSANKDRQRLTTHGADFWDLPLSRITRMLVAEKHLEITKAGTPGVANRFVQIGRTVWFWAKNSGKTLLDNPFHKQELNKEKAREVYLLPHELPIFWEAIHQEENVYLRSLALIVLFTGSRPEEVAKTKWEDVSFERKLWIKWDTKNGSDQPFPLTPFLIELFKSIPQKEGNPYVICGHLKKSHIANWSDMWDRLRVLKPALNHTVLYDLKSTFATYCESELGYPRSLVKKILNHFDGDVTAKYSLKRLKPIRNAVDVTGKFIYDVCTGKLVPGPDDDFVLVDNFVPSPGAVNTATSTITPSK